ncbi:hypothetical protein DPMN_067065 [Dreissena polymorpha]|uniref:Uncharacterized protein n=1 Tax=Dreissena polymorpha TaxID=45954 RepID=A0A9D3YUM4_DREPO|nr:hypothetical protein DPMN_067065 [Dreissena polymorpha]
MRTNVLTKFHEQQLTRFNYSHKNGTIFELIRNIIKNKYWTKHFHEHRTMNVASSLRFHEHRTINVATSVLTYYIKENASPPWRHFFQATETIFKLVQDMIGTYLLTRKHAPGPGGHCHDDLTTCVSSRKKCPPLGSHVFQATKTISNSSKISYGENLLTKCYEDWTIYVVTRV